MKTKLLLGLALVLRILTFAPLAVGQVPSAMAETNLLAPKLPRVIAQTAWLPMTNAIVGIPISPAELKLQRSVYTVRYYADEPNRDKSVNDEEIIAFQDPASGKLWTGWKAQFYVEYDGKMVGGEVDSGIVRFSGCPVSNQTNLASAIAEFEKKMADSPRTVIYEHLGDADLRHVLRWGFFARGDLDSSSVEVKVTSAKIKGSIVTIEMENPVHHSTATVRIELKTMKASKVAAHYLYK